MRLRMNHHGRFEWDEHSGQVNFSGGREIEGGGDAAGYPRRIFRKIHYLNIKSIEQLSRSGLYGRCDGFRPKAVL